MRAVQITMAKFELLLSNWWVVDVEWVAIISIIFKPVTYCFFYSLNYYDIQRCVNPTYVTCLKYNTYNKY
jgi:hypothetical protein